MSGHTPGPWHVIENHPTIRIHFSLPDGRESGSTVTIGSTALQFRAPRQGSHRGEQMVYRPFADHDRADARLIAAAPTLLTDTNDAEARLTWLAEQMNSITDNAESWGLERVRLLAQDLRIYIEGIQKRTRASIAKAEGRS
jgi:hypothetical protein